MMIRTPQAQAMIDAMERNWIAGRQADLEAAWDWYDDALSMVREFGQWPPSDFLHGIETDIYVARVVTDPRVDGAVRGRAQGG